MNVFTTLGKGAAHVLSCAVLVVLASIQMHAATAPNLRSVASYGVFSGAGAIESTGLTVITGDIGTHVGSFAGFPPGTYTGTKNVANAATLQAKDDLTLAYNSMNDATNAIIFDEAIGATMGNGQVLTPKTYRRSNLTTISGNLTFDAQGDGDAVFIIKIGAALNVSAYTNMILLNGAKAANIYWAVDGAVSILDYSVFKGNILSNGAIHLYFGASLEGRALAVVGAVTMANNVITVPTGGVAPPPPPPPPPGSTLTVINPSGGTIISGCTPNYQITWTGTGIADVKTLEYSIDSGATWRVISGMNSSATSYAWTVPNVVSSEAFVRVTDANNLSDTSDLFSIVSPNEVTGYTFSAAPGVYTEITTGTTHGSGTGIGNTEYALALPFAFVYHGDAYAAGTNIGVNSNGYVSFGTGYAGVTAPFTNVNVPTIAGWANHLTGNSNGVLSSETTGANGNRILTIQWKNFTRGPQANASADLFNFQIKIYETGRVEIVYGATTVNSEVGAQIGISRFCTRMAVLARSTVSPWDRPTITTNASDNESVASPTWVPATGQTYSFIPRSSPTTNNDAGVYALVNPAGKFNANASQAIQVRIKNWGTNNLDSVVVNWSIDGVVKTPVKYYSQPGLAPFAEANVSLGFATFATRSFSSLRVWTTLPNGATDAVPGNDAMVRYLAPRISGLFEVAQGNANPATFSDLISMLRHLRVSGISGDVTVRVSGNVSFDGQVYLAPIDNMLAGGRVSIVNRTGNTPSIQFQPVGAPLMSYGLYEYAQTAIIIEGGGASYTLNGLTVRLPNGTTSGGFVYGAANWLTGAAINNLRILNSNFVGPDNWAAMTAANDAIHLNNATGLNNEINRNAISSFPNGIRWNNIGGSGAKVLNNTIEGARFGAYVEGGTAMEISGNTFSGTSAFTDYMGISAYSAGSSTIANNRISADLSLVSSNGTGIRIMPITGATFTVTNNMIALGSVTAARGFDVQASYGGLTRLYHNTVHITGTGGASNVDLCINSTLVATPTGVVHSVNNIYSNAGTGGNGGYVIEQTDATTILNATTNSLAVSDFNDLYTTGPSIGLYDGVVVAKSPAPNPLAAWRLATSRDYNSTSVAPVFVGGSDLHLLTIQQGLFGTTNGIVVAPSDIDGDPRVKPYMGADEVVPQIVIVQQPQSRYACPGESFNLIAIADVTPGATVLYQWYKDGVKMIGRTSAILPLTTVSYGSSGVYTVIVTASDGTTTVTEATLPATIIVVRETQITEQPASQPVTFGGTVNLEVQAEAIGSPTDFVAAYQWKKRFWNPLAGVYQDSNVVDNGRITGSQSNLLTIRDIQASDTADSYVATVVGYCGSATSKAARLFIPQVVASNNTPDGCVGSNLQFEVAAFPSSVPGTTLSYQWFRNGARLSNDGRISGAISKTLTIANATAADSGTYYAEVTYGNGGTTIRSTSFDVTLSTPTVITTQPSDVTVCAGQPVQMTVVANGGNLSYRWFKGTSAIPGANGQTLNIPNANGNHTGAYTVLVSNGCGQVMSEIADVVVSVSPTITTQPNDATVDINGDLSLTVAATGTPLVTYQWYHDDVAIPGETNTTLTITDLEASEAGTYSVVATNACGSDTSRVVLVIVVGVTEDVVEAGYTLGVARPNPTTDVVNFTYTLPSTQNVRITLTDLMGRVLAVIVDGSVDAGTRQASFSTQGLNLTTGVYNYTISAGNFVASQQIVVIK